MSPIKLSIWHVDDAYQEIILTSEEFATLRSLQSQGFKGKELIDMWGFGFEGSGAPPRIVQVTGTAPTGEIVNEKIVYD